MGEWEKLGVGMRRLIGGHDYRVIPIALLHLISSVKPAKGMN